MTSQTKVALPLAILITIGSFGVARADDVTDVAREFKLPVPVVDVVFRNVDAFFASAEAPDNRMTSGLLKELSLKAIKTHMSSLEESGPGKASQETAEEKNATYKAIVKTTRHETTESAECVEATAAVTSSEGIPLIKDGTFTFDTLHPKVANRSWIMSFCRQSVNGGAEFSEWQLAAGVR